MSAAGAGGDRDEIKLKDDRTMAAAESGAPTRQETNCLSSATVTLNNVDHSQIFSLSWPAAPGPLSPAAAMDPAGALSGPHRSTPLRPPCRPNLASSRRPGGVIYLNANGHLGAAERAGSGVARRRDRSSGEDLLQRTTDGPIDGATHRTGPGHDQITDRPAAPRRVGGDRSARGAI